MVALSEESLILLSALDLTYPEWLDDSELYESPEKFLRNRSVPGSVKQVLAMCGSISRKEREAFKTLRDGVHFAK